MARVKKELSDIAPTEEEIQLVEELKEAIVHAEAKTPEVEKPVASKEHKTKVKPVTKKRLIIT